MAPSYSSHALDRSLFTDNFQGFSKLGAYYDIQYKTKAIGAPAPYHNSNKRETGVRTYKHCSFMLQGHGVMFLES